MTLSFDLPKTMLAEIESHLNNRALEIDGHIERVRIEDKILGRVLAAGRAAGYGKKKRNKGDPRHDCAGKG